MRTVNVDETLQTLPDLIALRAISNGALASESLPARIKLLNWGRNDSTRGPVILDESSVAALAVNQRSLGFDRVALDYEHNTVPGSTEYERTKEPRDVAAYGVPKLIPGDGLYLEALDWTPSGKSNAKNFADLSPTVGRTDDGRVTFVHSAGLVRNGSVFDLSFFSASNQPNKNNMPEKFITLLALSAALGLPETATEAEVTTKLKALSTLTPFDAKPLTDKLATLETQLAEIAKAKDGKTDVTTLAADFNGKLTTLTTEIKALKDAAQAATDAAASNERTVLITRFATEGKVPLNADRKPFTNEQLVALSVGEIKLLLANTPATVPLSARGMKPLEGKANTGNLTGLSRAIAAHQANTN